MIDLISRKLTNEQQQLVQELRGLYQSNHPGFVYGDKYERAKAIRQQLNAELVTFTDWEWSVLFNTLVTHANLYCNHVGVKSKKDWKKIRPASPKAAKAIIYLSTAQQPYLKRMFGRTGPTPIDGDALAAWSYLAALILTNKEMTAEILQQTCSELRAGLAQHYRESAGLDVTEEAAMKNFPDIGIDLLFTIAEELAGFALPRRTSGCNLF